MSAFYRPRPAALLALAACGALTACAAPPAATPFDFPPQDAQDAGTQQAAEEEDSDLGGFLDSEAGFLPLAVPITEPALGYGLGIGLVFFHTKPQTVETERGPRLIPPNATFVGGMGTANGSWGGAVGHLHTWDAGRVRYLVGSGLGSMNLEWFGEDDSFGGKAVDYNMRFWGIVQKLTFQVGDSDFFVGASQQITATSTHFETELATDEDIDPEDLNATISGLGLVASYDTRDNLFSPTTGNKTTFSQMQNSEVVGSDFDYGRMNIESCTYLPLGGPFTLGLRADAQYASDDAPFFDLAEVNMRGIQWGRYVDNTALTLESELRWDFSTRWTLLGFGGVGATADQFSQLGGGTNRWAGGTGFRYLVAESYGLRVGCDIAHGPDEWTFYVTVGTGWLRD